MNILKHATIGAIAGILPDISLWFFYFRKEWLPETSPQVKTHRFLHSYKSILLIIVMAFSSHVIIDKFSKHRTHE